MQATGKHKLLINYFVKTKTSVILMKVRRFSLAEQTDYDLYIRRKIIVSIFRYLREARVFTRLSWKNQSDIF